MAAPLQVVGTHGFSSVMALLGPQRLILDYVGLFQGVLSLGPELHTIVRLNRNMTIRVQQHFIRRRNAVLAKQMETFPTIVDDIRLWDWPSSLWPLPTWRRWRVEVWWCFDEYSRVDCGWKIQETFWFSRLPDLRELLPRVFTTAGLYAHRRLELSSWTWDYDSPWWQEEHHV